jgi:hypothetical protein
LKCKRTFRVYPEGTTHAQTSQRVKGLAVMLYLLGLSYGATSLALEALGVYLCKSRVYDADGFKTVADEAGVQHQVCKTHVPRNTEALIERYQPLVARDADGSLQAIGVSSQQAAADLTRLGELVTSRQREQATELEAMHRRYLEASPPQEGEHQSLAYRLRLLYLDRLPPVASLDTLSHVERSQGRNARWHQQCL